jgi:dimethylglycine dehydrogenase
LTRPHPRRLHLLEIFETDNPAARNEREETSGLKVYPFYNHPVLAAGRPVGIVTSAAIGHRTGKTLALAYIEVGVGSDAALEVSIVGDVAPARILAEPPYDPENRRLRLDADA